MAGIRLSLSKDHAFADIPFRHLISLSHLVLSEIVSLLDLAGRSRAHILTKRTSMSSTLPKFSNVTAFSLLNLFLTELSARCRYIQSSVHVKRNEGFSIRPFVSSSVRQFVEVTGYYQCFRRACSNGGRNWQQ